MGTHHPTPTPERDGAVWLAGEASGDFIASLVLPETIRRMDGAPQYGVGGDKMRAAGFHAWHDIRELSVRGYVEVLAHLPRLLRLRTELVERFVASDARVFVGVDAPDFNLSAPQGHSHGPLREPLHLGLASGTHPEDPRGGRPHAARLPV